MILTGMLLTAALLAPQCPPGTICPSPAVAVPDYSPPVISKSWHDVILPDGSIQRVWGWREGDQIRWYRSDQPEDPPERPAQPEPAPEPAAQPEPAGDVVQVTRNFGIDVARLRQEGRTIRASDPATLRLVTDQARKPAPAPDERPKIPNPLKRVEDDVARFVGLALAALMIISGLALVVFSRRRSDSS